MKWNATIIVAFLFFQSTRTDQNSSTKVLQNIIALFGLANWTKKVFPVFPRNIPYPARPKGPPFQFFSALRDFFRKIFSPKGSPLQFFAVLRQNGCWKIPKGPPFQFFSALRFFPKMKIFPSFNFLMFCGWQNPFNCDKNVDNFGNVPLSARQSIPLRYTSHPGNELAGSCEFDFCAIRARIFFWKFYTCHTLRALIGRYTSWHSFVLWLVYTIGPFFWVCIFFEKFFFVKFSIFEYCKREYLTLGNLFAIFEPWIWRRLGPVPACFFNPLNLTSTQHSAAIVSAGFLSLSLFVIFEVIFSIQLNETYTMRLSTQRLICIIYIVSSKQPALIFHK